MQAAFDEYLRGGGFPELLEETRRQAYINTLVNNILQNDIESRYSIKYKAAFEQLAQHLLNNAPAALNYRDLQQTFGFKSDHTVENYVNYCKNAYLICDVHKYSAKSKIRIRGEKAYAVDVALMNNRQNAFAGANLGWRLETIVYIELLRRYRNQGYDVHYYSEASGECDFVLCQGKTVCQLIQVSHDISSPKTLRREIHGLLLAARKTGCTDLLLVTSYDNTSITKDTQSISVVSAYSWLVDQQESG